MSAGCNALRQVAANYLVLCSTCVSGYGLRLNESASCSADPADRFLTAHYHASARQRRSLGNTGLTSIWSDHILQVMPSSDAGRCCRPTDRHPARRLAAKTLHQRRALDGASIARAAFSPYWARAAPQYQRSIDPIRLPAATSARLTIILDAETISTLRHNLLTLIPSILRLRGYASSTPVSAHRRARVPPRRDASLTPLRLRSCEAIGETILIPLVLAIWLTASAAPSRIVHQHFLWSWHSIAARTPSESVSDMPRR